MNGTRLQSLIYKGYGKAADKIGEPYQVYRPTAAITPAPISTSTNIGTLEAQFWVDENLTRPLEYGKATMKGWFDARNSAIGDYFVGPQGTFFIASLQANVPPLMVWCTGSINLFRPPKQPVVGSNSYGGTTQQNQVQLLGAWPASIRQESKGREGDVSLPGDMLKPWWRILVPNLISGVQIESADILTDDLGRRFIISSAERSPFGWRLFGQQALT